MDQLVRSKPTCSFKNDTVVDAIYANMVENELKDLLHNQPERRSLPHEIHTSKLIKNPKLTAISHRVAHNLCLHD